MNKTSILIINALLLLLAIIGSGIMTVSFFGSMGEDEVRLSNLMLAILNDSSKVLFPIVLGIAIKKQRYMHSIFLIILIVGTMVISFLASQGQDLNTSNSQLLGGSQKHELISMRNSLDQERQRLVSNKKLHDDRLSQTLKDEQSSWQRSELIKNNATVEAEYNNSISVINQKISDYNNQIINFKGDKSLTTSGYHALSNSLNVEVSTIVFYKNIFLELLAIGLSLNLGLLLTKNESEDATGSIESISDSKPINAIKTRLTPAIGFKASSGVGGSFTDDDLRTYLNYMYQTQREGISKGYGSISKATDIDVERCRKIKGYLEQKGIVRTQGNRTLILKEI